MYFVPHTSLSSFQFCNYHPQMKLWEGNVFRSVCHSVHMAGEGGGGMFGWGKGACVSGGCVWLRGHVCVGGDMRG